MANAGLLGWTNSICLTMASDPGRQLFKDQIQTHGFLFLDDYLDNILSGTKQDPLIELVKTPGRKKAVTKKLKLNSKLANVVTLSLEADSEKENVNPVNSFHKALLEAKAGSSNPVADSTPDMQSPVLATRGALNSVSQNSVVTRPATDIDTFNSSVMLEFNITQETHAALLDVIPRSDQNELSVIAEDDEGPERSRNSINPAIPDVLVKELADKDIRGNISPQSSTPGAVRKEMSPELDMGSTSSADTFHSVPLDSPVVTDRRISSPKLFTALDSNNTEPLSDVRSIAEGEVLHENTVTQLLPSPSENFTTGICDVNVPLHQVDDTTTLQLPIKAMSFPVLPEPMPLRKSMRAPRDPSMGTALSNAATPGAVVTGKRTSWLMKAREVKALEGIHKKVNPSLGANGNMSRGSDSTLTGGTKRKSGDMATFPDYVEQADVERPQKSTKIIESDVAPLMGKHSDDKTASQFEAVADVMESITPIPPSSTVDPEGVLNQLKKKVEGLGSRVGKSMGKSLGGSAANALAEAKAAAEARIAERNNKDETMTMAISPKFKTTPQVQTVTEPVIIESCHPETEHRLSITDLFPMGGKVKEKHKSPGRAFQSPSGTSIETHKANVARERISTTPQHSPPTSHSNSFIPAGPVFNKPPPVFVPPATYTKPTLATTVGKDFPFSLSSIPAFSIPATSTTLGLGTLMPSSSKLNLLPPLSAQSTLESIRSEPIFDDPDDIPAWMPSTQETDYSTPFGTQSQPSQSQQPIILDEDDSWPVDDKLTEGVQWTFGGGGSKEDSMTWSTLPSQSQRADTNTFSKGQASPTREGHSRVIPGAFDVEIDDDDDDELIARDSELEELVMGSGKETVNLIIPQPTRSPSQMSMASSISSTTQGGFLGQASKLISSALGTSKKGKPEVKKVLQMAAVAAKKQQEESDKKAARLKEMENRRQLAIQRKAEEEKARTQEQERKLKEEGERRKREREENTDKRPLKATGSKKDEEPAKKRKIELEKKPEVKKSVSALPMKTLIKPSLKQPTALISSAVYNTSALTIPITTPATKQIDTVKSQKSNQPSSILKGKAKAAGQSPVLEDDISQPSQIVQIQMAARAKAQIEAAKQTEPIISSESIELPDINSEYSDSDDEDRKRTFNPPEWAQSPELRQALEIQSTINPDDIFGAIRPLRMEELFKTRTSRFRARTSSANWTGTDRLTVDEEREYARRMGFK